MVKKTVWSFTVLAIIRREAHITVIRPLGAIRLYLHQSNFAPLFSHFLKMPILQPTNLTLLTISLKFNNSTYMCSSFPGHEKIQNGSSKKFVC